MGEIIHIGPGAERDVGEAMLVVKHREREDCKHVQSVVDPDLRRVLCSVCSEQLDPVEVLLGIARDRERDRNTVLRWERQRKALVKDVEDLKRQVRNLKAQKKRAAEQAAKEGE